MKIYVITVLVETRLPKYSNTKGRRVQGRPMYGSPRYIITRRRQNDAFPGRRGFRNVSSIMFSYKYKMQTP